MNDYKFGNFICQLRTEKGLSQSQLGSMIGVSNKAVSKWEMGVSKPRPDMLVTLATLFDVTVEELLAGERNAETENDERKDSRDNTIKLWAGEYLKKKKRGLGAVLTAILLPIIMFAWAGVMASFSPTYDIMGTIVAVVILFAEAIDIALIFVFYASARRLKRILYVNYHEQADEISAIISPKKEKVPMLRWERICYAVGCSSVSLCGALNIIVRSQVGEVLLVIEIVACIFCVLAGILALVAAIHYAIRVHKIKKQM
ncbi:MAG: helix-turn-helix domain-containing protein [Clostridia bacterium]|nr:helix-turn-helix domain-containing protein [Clostridia bacterium]